MAQAMRWQVLVPEKATRCPPDFSTRNRRSGCLRLFDTADELFDACEEYFEWLALNPYRDVKVELNGRKKTADHRATPGSNNQRIVPISWDQS